MSTNDELSLNDEEKCAVDFLVHTASTGAVIRNAKFLGERITALTAERDALRGDLQEAEHFYNACYAELTKTQRELATARETIAALKQSGDIHLPHVLKDGVCCYCHQTDSMVAKGQYCAHISGDPNLADCPARKLESALAAARAELEKR